ncbi:phosphoesterase [Nitriliruptoria bacterium AS10]|nr:phosphoesterase [Salsipaludibacter albus]
MVRLGSVLADGPATITNVFVLMLENHSFDNVFGQSGLPGITAGPVTSNTWTPEGGAPRTFPVGSPAPVAMSTDPGHEFDDVLEQLCGPGDQVDDGAHHPPLGPGGAYPSPIDMSGFAQNYATTTSEGTGLPAADQVGDIMMGFDTAKQLPTMYELASEYVLCDHWFASMPGPTWPNRFFVHAGSSGGLDHSPSNTEILGWELGTGFALQDGTVYDALDAGGRAWRVYIDDTNAYSDEPSKGSILGAVPQVSALKGVSKVTDVFSMTHFASDLQNPYPYAYTFIEPNWGDVTSSYQGGSSQHPMDDVAGGEGLLNAVYTAIRNSPVWNTSLLIVTYDEHGGFFDSVAPGATPPPGDDSSSPGNPYNASGFDFATHGVRVPALVVSPWVAAGVVDHTVREHSSVPATVAQLFGVAAPARASAAPFAGGVVDLLTQATPRTDAPTTIASPPAPTVRPHVTEEELAAEDREPIPQTGNLPGFLAIALKTRLELTDDPDERAALVQQYEQLSTRGEARTFIGRAMAMADAVPTPDENRIGATTP